MTTEKEYVPHAYNARKHNAMFGPQIFGRNSSEPKPDAVLGTTLVLVNLAVFLGVIMFLAFLPGILHRRRERRRRSRLMEDTDTAHSAEGMEMMNVGEPEARPAQSSDHEEQGQKPQGAQLVALELEKLRMTMYTQKLELHGYDHWP